MVQVLAVQLMNGRIIHDRQAHLGLLHARVGQDRLHGFAQSLLVRCRRRPMHVRLNETADDEMRDSRSADEGERRDGDRRAFAL